MIKIRISGEFAKAAAETLSKSLWFPQAQNGNDGAVFMLDNGDAELRLGLSSQLHEMVREKIKPLMRSESNADGIFSSDTVWENPVMKLEAL